MKISLPKNIQTHFKAYKNKYNETSDTIGNSCEDKILGHLWWTIPEEVLWLYATQDGEDSYDGSETQVGVKKDGTVVWGYFSHCSCYGYEGYAGDYKELSEENLVHTQKIYELTKVDSEVLSLIKERLKLISKQGLVD